MGKQYKYVLTAILIIIGGVVFFYYGLRWPVTKSINEDVVKQEVENNQIAAKTALQANHDPLPNLVRGGQPDVSKPAIDTNVPGVLEIPSINVIVPLIWTKDTKNFDEDLKKGVVHYPGTALPGELGTAYVSGHSSGYAWDRSPYKKIFSRLGDVPDYGSFTITVTLTDGTKLRPQYVVARRGIYKPDDQEQFKNTPETLVALSTCWPVGTTKDRLVLFGKLTSTEKL